MVIIGKYLSIFFMILCIYGCGGSPKFPDVVGKKFSINDPFSIVKGCDCRKSWRHPYTIIHFDNDSTGHIYDTNSFCTNGFEYTHSGGTITITSVLPKKIYYSDTTQIDIRSSCIRFEGEYVWDEEPPSYIPAFFHKGYIDQNKGMLSFIPLD